MAFFTYILRSALTGRFYIGHAEDLARRVGEHNSNRVDATKYRGPWEVAYTEEFATRAEAGRRERYIKSQKSRKWIEQLVRASR